MSKAGRPPIEMSGDARDFVQFFGKTSTLDKKVKTSLRKEMKTAADHVASDVKAEVAKPSLHRAGQTDPDHGPRVRTRGLRRHIAAGVGVTLKASEAKRVGVFITASGKNLPAEQKRLLRLYNRQAGWRHPVFSTARRIAKAKNRAQTLRAMGSKGLAKHQLEATRNTGKWVPQKGRPYFGVVIEKDAALVEQAVRGAVEKARREAGL